MAVFQTNMVFPWARMFPAVLSGGE